MEALSRTLIQRKFCPVVQSNVKGTPNLKFMGIFSENCPEFYITQLACISDSVTIVPISADAQFLDSERVTNIIEATGLTTVCVSSKTGGFLLDLKTNGKISTLKNIIVFDETNE